jgi:hypothetical protein
MRPIHVLFIHGTLKHFSTKTSNFIKYWNKRYKDEFIISVFALEHCQNIEKHTPNEYELVVKDYIKGIYSLSDTTNYNLQEKIKKINPDIVLMFDDAFLMNAALNNVCRKLNIPTMYIQHGEFIQEPVKKDIRINLFFSKVIKYLKFFKFYINSRKFNITDYPILFYKLFRMSLYNESVNPRVKIPDFHCDYAAVWNETHKKNALVHKGYKNENIFIVGNPDGMNDFSTNLTFNPKSKNVLYIVQPLVNSNLISETEYLNWAKKLVNSISDEFQLVVRPHPKSDIKYLKSHFPKAVITIDEKLPVLATIGHFSTYSVKAKKYVPSILLNFKQTEKYAKDIIYNDLPKINAYDFDSLLDFLYSIKKNIDYNKQELSHEFKMDFYKSTTRAIVKIVKT